MKSFNSVCCYWNKDLELTFSLGSHLIFWFVKLVPLIHSIVIVHI